MASSLYKFQVALRLCEEHNQKELIAYCKPCEKKICSSCIKEDHNKHDWEMITDILREKKRTLPEECKEIRAEQLPNLKKEIERFNGKMQKEDVNLRRNISVLNRSRHSYIYKINKLFDDRIDECQQKHHEAIIKYKEIRDALQQKVGYLEKMTTSLDKDINTLPDHDILDMEKEMRDELEKVLSYNADKYTCTSIFVPGQIDVQNLENMTGEIHSVSLDELYDIDRYHETISSISPISDTNAWMRTFEEKNVKLIDSNGQVQKTMNTPCGCLNILRNGEFVVDNEKKRIISVLTKTETVITTIDTKPLYPIFISKTENDDLLVSLVDCGDRFNLTPTSRRIVQRMTCTGKVLNTYEFREDGQTRLFAMPIKTAENKNTDICVVNWLSDDSGELVILHKDGRLNFTYRGDGMVSEKFVPIDTACDEKCHILLTEVYSRSIQMLSDKGMFLFTICRFEQLIPYVISIRDDNLWCGFRKGRMKVFRFISK